MAITGVVTSIVEKASGRSFIDYLRDELLAPLGIRDVHVGATGPNLRRPKEVSTYDAVGASPSQIDMAVGAIAPNAYGGTFALENGEGAGGLIMSTATVARFLATHDVYNIGPRDPGSPYASRTGVLEGTMAAAASRPDGLDFACAFNRRVEDADLDAIVKQIDTILDLGTRVRFDSPFATLIASVAKFVARFVEFARALVGLGR